MINNQLYDKMKITERSDKDAKVDRRTINGNPSR